VNAPKEHREFRALFEAESAYVVRAMRRFGVPERDCPDVAHEVFMVALRHLPSCDTTRPMRPWLFGIATRVARDYRRLARVRCEVSGEPMELLAEGPSPHDALHAQEQRKLVNDALDALNGDQREVFVLHEMVGLSMPEIAEALGIALNTGYSRLRLARAAFTARIKRVRGADVR
jgi:RNA polymerase sigma-70 factor, ECF subfamily